MSCSMPFLLKKRYEKERELSLFCSELRNKYHRDKTLKITFAEKVYNQDQFKTLRIKYGDKAIKCFFKKKKISPMIAKKSFLPIFFRYLNIFFVEEKTKLPNIKGL